MNAKKLLALMLALVMAVCGCVSALAEEEEKPDVLGDIFSYFLGDPRVEATTAPDENGGYLYDDGEEQIYVDSHVEVADYAITEGLDDEWLNILLLGTDSRTVQRYSRTDTMIVLSVNSGTGEAKLTSIMRDIWVDIPGHGHQKLNAACVFGGPELTVRIVNQKLGLNIEHYALVNMIALAEIVDLLGGIRVDVNDTERRAMNMIMEPYSSLSDTALVESSGDQLLLNGNQALAYSRIRKLDSDYARTERQREVLVIIASRLQQENLLTLTGILTRLLTYVDTNLTMDEIMTLMKVGMSMDLANVTEFRIPADGTYDSGMYGSVWAIKPNFEKNAQKLHEFIYGDGSAD